MDRIKFLHKLSNPLPDNSSMMKFFYHHQSGYGQRVLRHRSTVSARNTCILCIIRSHQRRYPTTHQPTQQRAKTAHIHWYVTNGNEFIPEFVYDVLINALEDARDNLIRLREVPMEEKLEHFPDDFLPDNLPFVYQEALGDFVLTQADNFIAERTIEGAQIHNP